MASAWRNGRRIAPHRPIYVRPRGGVRSVTKTATATASRSATASITITDPLTSPTTLEGWEATASSRTATATIVVIEDGDPDGLDPITEPWIGQPDESGETVTWATHPETGERMNYPAQPSAAAAMPRGVDSPEPVMRYFLRKQWFEISGPPDFDSDHQPISDSWPLTQHASDWGFYRIHVGHKNVTFFRRAQTIITDLADTEPGGDDTCTLTFPMVGPHEAIGVGDLEWLPAHHGDEHVPVRVAHIHTDGEVGTQWEGDVSADQDTFDGNSGQLVLRVTGLIKTLDDRITKPRQNTDPIDCGLAITRLVHHEHKYGWPGHPPRAVDTGIMSADRYGYGDPLYSNTIVNLLARMQFGTNTRYTLVNTRPRGMAVAIKDLETVDITLWCGQPGTTHDLVNDATRRYDAIFGEGQTDGIRYWRNTQYPNMHFNIPDYPGGAGFGPGDSDGALSKFFRELRHHGYDVDSRDTYLARDEDDVIEFQKDAGVTADGVIRAQTWTAAWTAGQNQNILESYIRPLAVRTGAEPFLYNARGGIIGDNPGYVGRPRREVLRQYGTLSRKLARKSAKNEMKHLVDTDYIGTITMTNVDPPEMGALSVRSGMNIRYFNHRGNDRLFHIARVNRDPGMVAGSNRTVTLTVSERGDDWMSIAERRMRHRDVLDVSGRTRPPRRHSKHTPDFAPWDEESGAGFLRPVDQTGGRWSVYPFPGGERGSMVHTRLVASIPTLISAAVFNWHTDPAQIDRLPGLTNPHRGIGGDSPPDPWQANADILSRTPTYADQSWLAFATGSLDSMQGYWPADPLADTPTITGVLDDSMTWPFHSKHAPWLWLAIWTRDDCSISGDPDYDYRAFWPAPDV